jgi:hypothetical protein
MRLADKLTRQLRENEHILQVIPLEDFRNEFLENKDTIKGNVGYASSAILDAPTATKLLRDFGLKPHMLRIKEYGEKSYVIFKGYAGQRTILKGTKYLKDNPKLVNMAIGPKGIVKSVKGGFALTFVLHTGVEVLNYILNDTSTLAALLGTLTGDLAKVGISSAASVVAGLAVGGSAIVGTTVAMPFLIAVGVGILTGIALDAIDNRFGITDTLIKGYEKIGLHLRYIESEVNRTLWHFERNPHLIKNLFY